MDAQTVATTRAAFLGLHWAGTVTDPETSATASYDWFCDNVLWDGRGDRLRVVLNNGDEAYREFCFDAEALAGAQARIGSILEATALAQLERDRWQDVVGEVL
jgi:hypothetical protein